MADDTPLAGKVALVAGATRGAGRAIAVELARAGPASMRPAAAAVPQAGPRSTGPRPSRRPAT